VIEPVPPLTIRVGAGMLGDLSRDPARVIPLPPLPWDLHREAIVTRDEQDRPRAYLNRCKHLPVPLDGGTRDFFDSTRRYLICGTHGALYERATGFCVSGPCRGKVLTPIDLSIDPDGAIWLLLAE
jgi:nitrite reductase/ring-hydroxylating ferredoxin subunit